MSAAEYGSATPSAQYFLRTTQILPAGVSLRPNASSNSLQDKAYEMSSSLHMSTNRISAADLLEDNSSDEEDLRLPLDQHGSFLSPQTPTWESSPARPASSPAKTPTGLVQDRTRGVGGLTPPEILLDQKDQARLKSIRATVDKKMEGLMAMMSAVRLKTEEDLRLQQQADLEQYNKDKLSIDSRSEEMTRRMREQLKAQFETEQQDSKRRSENIQQYEALRAEEERQAEFRRKEAERAKLEAEAKARQEQLARDKAKAEEVAKARQQQAEALRQQQLQQQQAAAAAAAPAQVAMAQTAVAPAAAGVAPQPVSSVAFKQLDNVSSCAFVVNQNLLAKLAREEDSLKDFMQSANKKEIFKHVNKTCYQISNTTDQIKRVMETLQKQLDDTRNMPAEHKYSLTLIAEKLVEQSEKQISKNKPTAFSVAAVIVFLSTKNPGFLDFILAHLQRKCPYTVPMYPKRVQGQSDEDYLLNGLKYDKIGDDFEDEESYFTRMCGFIYLYSAVLSVRCSSSDPPSKPGGEHGIDKAWTWIARLVNMPPRKITPFVLLAFLENTGIHLLKRYGDQFVKVLFYIKAEIVPKIPAGVAAAKARLELYLEHYEQKKTLPPPDK